MSPYAPWVSLVCVQWSWRESYDHEQKAQDAAGNHAMEFPGHVTMANTFRQQYLRAHEGWLPLLSDRYDNSASPRPHSPTVQVSGEGHFLIALSNRLLSCVKRRPLYCLAA